MAKQQTFFIHASVPAEKVGGDDHGEFTTIHIKVPAFGLDQLIERLTVIKDDGHRLEHIEFR